MNRILGTTLGLVVSLCLGTASEAQTTYYDGTTSPGYGAAVVTGQPYGGFGMQYSPAIPAGGVIVDQWGGLHAVGQATTAPVVAAQPKTRVVGSRMLSRRAAAQPRYVLPTGSLGWSDGNGGMLYSPDARYSSYGNGYGVGPYGMVDHRVMWKW
jgi:hypothetical protein